MARMKSQDVDQLTLQEKLRILGQPKYVYDELAAIDWYIEYLKETVKVIDNMPPLKPNQTYRYSYWY